MGVELLKEESKGSKIFEGEKIFYLDIPRTARVKSASITIKGAKFAGNIASSYGTTQETAPDKDNKVSQVIIDFHSLRTINRLILEVAEGTPQKCEVKVWGGMSWFLPGPEYRFDFTAKKIDTLCPLIP